MRGVHYIAGLAVFSFALAGGWAALAWAQAGGDQQPTDLGQSVEPAPQSAPQIPSPVNTLPAVPSVPGGALTQPATPILVDPTPVHGVPYPAQVAPAVNSMQPVANPRYNAVGIKAAPAAPAAPAVAGGAEEQELGPGQEEKNPTGRQEPAISIEWIGPPVVKLGRPADYTVAVRNACNTGVQQVVVRVRVPQGMTVTATEPKAVAEGNVLMWEVGTLLSKQEKNLQVRMVPDSKGLVGCQAWVTFTGSSSMKIKVSEPKLLLKAQAPDRVMLGDPATVVLTVHNPGDGPADQVKIHADLSPGLEHTRGKRVDFEIGNLAPGESRSVQLACNTKLGGVQFCDAMAEAEGDLKSQDKANVNVLMPRLELEAAGPKLRYLDRKAVYTFKVTNPGDAPATNVTVNDIIPDGFKFASASDGGRHDFSTRTISWFVGELGPAQAKEVKLEVIAVNPGEWHHKGSAQAARGLRAENEVLTKVEGLSAILLEVVDTEDPIEVGADTSYEIRVTNTGTKTETDIKLACTIPDKMQFKTAQGPVRFHEQGREIIFEPLPKLAPRADAIFRIHVKAIAPGGVRFKTQLTSTNLQEPVIEQEATRIYED